jgi:hypothetical protein
MSLVGLFADVAVSLTVAEHAVARASIGHLNV